MEFKIATMMQLLEWYFNLHLNLQEGEVPQHQTLPINLWFYSYGYRSPIYLSSVDLHLQATTVHSEYEDSHAQGLT